MHKHVSDKIKRCLKKTMENHHGEFLFMKKISMKGKYDEWYYEKYVSNDGGSCFIAFRTPTKNDYYLKQVNHWLGKSMENGISVQTLKTNIEDYNLYLLLLRSFKPRLSLRISQQLCMTNQYSLTLIQYWLLIDYLFQILTFE